MTDVIQMDVGGQTKRSRFKPIHVETDFDALPDVSRAFVIRYGLRQFLADAMAGAESEADAHAGVAERLAKLTSGDLTRTRGNGGDKPDTVDTRALRLARAFIRDQLKAANKSADKERIAEAAAKLVETQPKWKAEAKKELDAEAKSRAALADDESAAILADLFPDEEEAEEAADE